MKLAARAVSCLAIVTAAALSGCSSMAVWSFKPAPESGAGKGKVELYISKAGDKIPLADAATFPNLQSSLQACGTPSAGLLATSLVPVVGKLLFDLYLDKQIRDLKALKDSSLKPYSAGVSITGHHLTEMVANLNCLVIVRSEAGEAPQSIAVLALSAATTETPIKAFRFRPIYVATRSSIAVTRQAEQPAISSSFAVTLRGIGVQKIQLPTLAPIGEASVTVPKVRLGKALGAAGERCLDKDVCPTSDPIPTHDAGAVLTLTVGVAEQGDIGVDFDAAEAELKAIKEAFGPAIKDVLKDRYEN